MPAPTLQVSPPRTAVLPWVAFAALALGQLLVDVDDVVLNIALPSIAATLQLPEDVLPWVVNAYVLCFGVLLLLGGRLADRYGARRVLLAGVGVFAVASAGGTASASLTDLLAARAGQGLAAALLAPAAMSMLIRTFTEPRARARALGLWGGVTAGGAVIGLIAGGVVTEAVGWRWVFAGNAVISVAVGVSVWVLLPGGGARPDVRIEPGGALAATAGLVLGEFALHQVPQQGWSSVQVLACLGAAAMCLAVAVVSVTASADPLVPHHLLRRAVVVSDLCGMLVGAGLLGTFFFVSLHLQQVAGYPPVAAALAYLPLVGMLLSGAATGSVLVPRRGSRPVLVAGMLCCAAGLGLLGELGMRTDGASYVAAYLPGMVVTGLGLGLAMVALTVTAVPGGEVADGGVASGLYNTAVQVGGAVGIAVLSTVATARSQTLAEAGSPPLEALTGGRSAALLIGAAVLAGAALLALALPRAAGRETERHVESRS